MTEEVKNFLAYMQLCSKPHASVDQYRVFDHFVIFRIGPHAGGVRLWYLRSLQQNQGHARTFIGFVKRKADDCGVPVRGIAKKMDRKGLSTKELKAWYARHGFTVDAKTGKFNYKPKARSKDVK